MTSQSERRGSKSSHHHTRPPLSSMEEITFETGSRLLKEEKARKLSMQTETTRNTRKSARRSAKRGSMQPSHKEKKISMDENDMSTGDSNCDRLIRRINDGNTNRLEDVYALKQKIGEGAFAKVYMAVHRETGKKYALKIMSLDTTDFEKQVAEKNKNMIARSEDAIAKRNAKQVMKKLAFLLQSIDIESYIMKKVAKFSAKDKRSLVTLHETMANKDQVIFVMELLSGGELFERVAEKGEYSETDAAYLMRKVMRGIRSLHQNGIVHRDLKPENIVFETEDEDSRIKITDFGLAFKVGERDIFDSVIVGSPSYMAPEILTNRLYSPAGDIWAMGCILFILLVGGPPFAGTTNDELFENIKKGEYKFPPECGLSDSAKDLIGKMLTIDPNARLTANQVLKHSWINKKAQSAQLKHSFNQIKAFNARRRLKKLALAVVVNSRSGKAKMLKELLLNTSKENGFTGGELFDLRDIWFNLGDDQDKITVDDFQAGFEKLEINDLPYQQLFEVFAKDKELYPAAEFCVGFSTVCQYWKGQDALRYCFDTYDRNGEGKISKDDLRKILRVVFGEKQLEKVAGGMNSVLNAILRKKPNVSYRDFTDAVGRNGGDWNVKEKLLDPMATLVKNMSKIGLKQMSRISTNVSIASGNMKRSMTRSMTRVTYGLEDNRSNFRMSMGFQRSSLLSADSDMPEISLDNFPQHGTLPRALVTREKKVPNPRMKSNPRNKSGKRFLMTKNLFRFSSGRPKSNKGNKGSLNDRKLSEPERKSSRKAYLIRRVPNSNGKDRLSNLTKGDQVCEQEYDLLQEWDNFPKLPGRHSNLLRIDADKEISQSNPRQSLQLKLKQGLLVKRIAQKSQFSDEESENGSESDNSN